MSSVSDTLIVIALRIWRGGTGLEIFLARQRLMTGPPPMWSRGVDAYPRLKSYGCPRKNFCSCTSCRINRRRWSSSICLNASLSFVISLMWHLKWWHSSCWRTESLSREIWFVNKRREALSIRNTVTSTKMMALLFKTEWQNLKTMQNNSVAINNQVILRWW